jgi:hypothetical protein
VKHQFRTTVVPGMVIEDEVREFFSYLKEPIVFQEYRESEHHEQMNAERKSEVPASKDQGHPAQHEPRREN